MDSFQLTMMIWLGIFFIAWWWMWKSSVFTRNFTLNVEFWILLSSWVRNMQSDLMVLGSYNKSSNSQLATEWGWTTHTMMPVVFGYCILYFPIPVMFIKHLSVSPASGVWTHFRLWFFLIYDRFIGKWPCCKSRSIYTIIPSNLQGSGSRIPRRYQHLNRTTRDHVTEMAGITFEFFISYTS